MGKVEGFSILEKMAGAMAIRKLVIFAFSEEKKVDPGALENWLYLYNNKRRLMPEEKNLVEELLKVVGEGEQMRNYINKMGGRGVIETNYLIWDRDKKGESDFFIPAVGVRNKK